MDRKKYFADEYGEWYGYLRRDGKPTQPTCKDSTFPCIPLPDSG